MLTIRDAIPEPEAHWFIRARLKTRQLLLLVTLADEGNIHRAARVMNMTQPAASKLLKDLEEVLSVQLFERMPRGMRPTLYGEAIIRHARMALANLGQAYDEVTALKNGLQGQVRVGAITTPGITLMPQAMARVKQAYPHLRITLQIDSSPALLHSMAQGKLDIVVARLEADQDLSMYRYTPLSDEPVSALVRSDHPLLKLPEVTLPQLVRAAWIVPPVGSVLRHRFDLMFQQAGLVPPINLIETSSLLFVTKMVEQSDAIALVSDAVGRYYASHRMAALLPMDLPCRMDDFGWITWRDQLPSPGARVMMRALQSAASHLYGRELTHEWLTL
jgi:DNA-binding transcriptional LysR family regulator